MILTKAVQVGIWGQEPESGGLGVFGRGGRGHGQYSKPFPEVDSKGKQRNELTAEAEYDVKGGFFFFFYKQEIVEQVLADGFFPLYWLIPVK